jgi:putative acetyltransferase
MGPLDGGGDSVCELKKMYLLPDTRGLGLGEELLDHCLEAARKAGYDTCYLETIREMTTAGSLYTKHGFGRLEKPMGDTGHFRTDQWFARAL